jgi:hypothetical protein
MKIYFLRNVWHNGFFFIKLAWNLFSAGTKVSRQSNPTVSVTMEAETQTEEEQVNIIEPSDPINYSNGHWTFCSWH